MTTNLNLILDSITPYAEKAYNAVKKELNPVYDFAKKHFDHYYAVAHSNIKSLISFESLSTFKALNADAKSDVILKVAIGALAGMLLSGTLLCTLVSVGTFAHVTNKENNFYSEQTLPAVAQPTAE